MTKKIISIIILIVIVAVGYWAYKESRKSTGENTYTLDPGNCTYVIEGENITLNDGYLNEEIIPGSASRRVTQYFGNEAQGDFNGDGFYDVAFVLSQNSGGSGTFYYVTVALGGEKNCTGTNAVLLGDRISPQSTESREGEIIVNYAGRKPGEPMTAELSIGVSKYLKVENGRLVEIQK